MKFKVMNALHHLESALKKIKLLEKARKYFDLAFKHVNDNISRLRKEIENMKRAKRSSSEIEVLMKEVKRFISMREGMRDLNLEFRKKINLRTKTLKDRLIKKKNDSKSSQLFLSERRRLKDEKQKLKNYKE